MAVVDALGYLVRFVILPGQAHDLAGVPALLDGLPFAAFVGDKAFDADWLPDDLEGRGAEAVIPRGGTGRSHGSMTGTCTADGTWWRTSSRKSRSSERS